MNKIEAQTCVFVQHCNVPPAHWKGGICPGTGIRVVIGGGAMVGSAIVGKGKLGRPGNDSVGRDVGSPTNERQDEMSDIVKFDAKRINKRDTNR